MISFNRRLFFWLIKAYVRKWGRIILLSFVGGLLAFFFFIFFSRNIAHLFPQKTRVGMVGAYKLSELPANITQQLSRGLTKVGPDNSIHPDLAKSWEIKQDGKQYVFHLNQGIHFSNGTEVTSDKLSYAFKDAKVEKPDKYTIIFTLKDKYAPFLVTVSRPIFPKGLDGLGEYTIADIKINGDFISNLTLAGTKNKLKQITYVFYPNQESLKTAYLLGETTKIIGINNTRINGTDLAQHRNSQVERETNYNQLVTIFYNTKDEIISDNKLRKAFTYSLPDTFVEGEQTFLPYPRSSLYYNNEIAAKPQDLSHAKLLIDATYGSASSSARAVITVKVLSRYRAIADRVTKIWNDLGVKTKIEEVESRPDIFQVYIGDFSMPKDPDQYELWHSKSDHNITRFNSKRIDKLLEDGRGTVDIKERKQIYDEFQRFLLDDALIDTPASFLYFPYIYTVTRR